MDWLRNPRESKNYILHPPMPWVGYKDDTGGAHLGGIGHGKVWMWAILGLDLVLKSVASVGGLTSSLLLVGHLTLDT